MTRPRVVATSAPGKLVLMGEYAVLRGHTAVVAAVDVRATTRLSEADDLRVDLDDGGLLQACLDEAAALGVRARGVLHVDTQAFRDEADRKLGLGSSAAACVATLHALLLAGDVDIGGVDGLHAAAQRAHRRFQRGRGSGIDVAASTYGGLVRFVRHDDDVHAGPAPSLPAALAIVPVWTGRSQDTRDFVAAVLAQKNVDELVAPIGDATARFVDACVRNDDRDVLAAVDDAAVGMAHLGAQAGIDVVSAPHVRLAAIARAHGGRAKPSGAGGGDIGLVFVRRDDVAALRAALVAEGLSPLSLRLGDGVDGATRADLGPRLARGETR